jgi:hypothetical protein
MCGWCSRKWSGREFMRMCGLLHQFASRITGPKTHRDDTSVTSGGPNARKDRESCI